MSATTYLIRATLDSVFGSSNTVPIYLAIHTGNPGATGSANEVSGNGYARQLAAFSGTTTRTNAADVVWPAASPAGYGSVSWYSAWSALSGGNCLFYGFFSNNPVVGQGEHARILAGAISVTVT